eukprot:g39474.t1
MLLGRKLDSTYGQVPVSSVWNVPPMKGLLSIAVVVWISDNNESEYKKEIEALVMWCNENNLPLNISKTKELIIDFRNKGEHAPIYISGAE